MLLGVAANGLKDGEKDDGSKECDQEAIEVEASHVAFSDNAHNPSAEKGAENTDDNIHDCTLAGVSVHDFGRDPANECSKNDPENDSHSNAL